MRPISSWAHMMKNTVVVAPLASVDTYGKPTYGAAVSYSGHLAQGTRMMRTPTGEDIMCSAQFHMATPVLVQPTARITLSTGDIGSTESYMVNPLLVAAEQHYDGAGLHHTVLWLSWAKKSV